MEENNWILPLIPLLVLIWWWRVYSSMVVVVVERLGGSGRKNGGRGCSSSSCGGGGVGMVVLLVLVVLPVKESWPLFLPLLKLLSQLIVVVIIAAEMTTEGAVIPSTTCRLSIPPNSATTQHIYINNLRWVCCLEWLGGISTHQIISLIKNITTLFKEAWDLVGNFKISDYSKVCQATRDLWYLYWCGFVSWRSWEESESSNTSPTNTIKHLNIDGGKNVASVI